MSTLYLKNVGAATQEPVDNNNPLPVTLSAAGGGNQPAPVLPTTTAVPSTSASVAILGAGANRRLVGYSFRENAGSTASAVLHNHASAPSAPLVYITLAPNESVDMDLSRGRVAAAGLYLEVVSGTVIGIVDTLVAP